MLRRRIITIAIALSLIIGIIYSLVWFASTGSVDVKVVNGSGNSSYSYSFSGNSSSSEVESEATHVKKRLKKGTYFVTVQSNESSSIKLISVGGWLKTSSVDLSLEPEKAREFVGDEPGFCMNYSQDFLYSFDCSEPGGLKAHQPAKADTPTSVVSEAEPPYLNLRDIITVQGKPRAFVVDPDGHSGDSGVEMYNIDQSLSLDGRLDLQGVGSTTNPRAMAYKDGYVVYSKDFSVIKFFDPTDEDGSDIGQIKPAPEYVNPVELSIFNDEFGGLFNGSNEGEDIGSSGNTNDKQEVSKGESQFVFLKSKQTIKLKKTYTSGVICGENRLCLIGNHVLDIYEVRGNKAKLIVSFPGAEKVAANNGKISLITDKGLVVLDQTSLNGSLYYSFAEGAGYCGFTSAGDKYVVCATNEKAGTSALLVDPSRVNDDSIDKKIAKLISDESIKDISIYKKFIFISPSLNEFVYDPVLNIQTYNPEKLKESTNKINSLISSSGIDRNKYSISNVLE